MRLHATFGPTPSPSKEYWTDTLKEHLKANVKPAHYLERGCLKICKRKTQEKNISHMNPSCLATGHLPRRVLGPHLWAARLGQPQRPLVAAVRGSCCGASAAFRGPLAGWLGPRVNPQPQGPTTAHSMGVPFCAKEFVEIGKIPPVQDKMSFLFALRVVQLHAA